MAKVDRSLAAHHRLIVQTIDSLIHGRLDKRKVMILTPPGSAKSTYTSKLLPAWFCNPEAFPTDLMLACSFSYSLVEQFGREARDIVKEEEKTLGAQLSSTAAAAGDWRVSTGGGYFCGGVGSSITGHRAKLGLIDDYVASEESIDSLDQRDKHWKWYWNDFWPRLLPNESWTFIIANRRHEDDLVGRLLEKESDKWHVIKLPFFAEENDPLGRPAAQLSLLDGKELTTESQNELEKQIISTRLWPEWYSEEQALEVLHLPDDSTKAGLWQQSPQTPGGNYFKEEDLLEYGPADLPPENELRIYGASDWAVRKQTKNDRTCHLLAGVDSQGRIWILPDWFWKRCDTGEGTQAMFNMAKRRKTMLWWHGRENITGAIGPFVYQKMRDDEIFIPIEELSEGQDKQAKAQSIKARTGAKMVLFPKFAPAWSEAKKELLAFPNGKNDDFVDALAKFGLGLDKMVKGSKSKHDKTVEQVLNCPITCGWAERSSSRKQSKRSTSRFESMQN